MGLYRITNDVPQLENSFCLFVDVLGFAKEILEHAGLGSSQTHLESFSNSVKEASKAFTRNAYNWDYKIFTDNVVIGSPLRSHLDTETYFGFMVIALLYYQLEMTLNGFFLRGGWAIGDLYMDENLVYGKSLIDAHLIESEVATYPRIALSSDMNKLVAKHLNYYAPIEDAPQRLHLLKDNKGVYFLNYLYGLVDDDGYPHLPSLEKHKTILEGRIVKYQEDDRVLTKYLWCAQYHNYFCRNFIEGCPEQFYIPRQITGFTFSKIP